MAIASKTLEIKVNLRVLWLFHVVHVVQNGWRVFTDTNGHLGKAEDERFDVAGSRCCQNLKSENFTSSFGRPRQRNDALNATRPARTFNTFLQLTQSAKQQAAIFKFKALTTTWAHNSKCLIPNICLNGTSNSPFVARQLYWMLARSNNWKIVAIS